MHLRVLTLTLAAATTGALTLTPPAGASLTSSSVAAHGSAKPKPNKPSSHKPHKPKPHKPKPSRDKTIQLLSFNDFHGHLEASDPPLSPQLDPSQTPAGGAEYLATTLKTLRAKVGEKNSATVAAGDLIGASPFLSGAFHDEPTVESLDALGLDVSSVGNHEFDEGTNELLRMQNGGCHPIAGCVDPKNPYQGAKFSWLAANVVRKSTNKPLLPGTKIKKINGTKVGFIGMTLKATPTLVTPSGVATVDFKDEVSTANSEAAKLSKRGVKAIVVLIHEGGIQSGTYQGCNGISGPIAQMATQFSPEIDQIVSGHTHQPYVCSIKDPKGQPRLVTSAASYGQVVTESTLKVDPRTGDVNRAASVATNRLVTREKADPTQTSIINKWKALVGPVAARVVGSVAQDIGGDASGDRGLETPMSNVVADSILDGTDGADGGAQIAFMNTAGVRASLLYDQISSGEKPGEVTYSEAYSVLPFGNSLASMDMTGAQIKTLLEQQYQPIPERGSRPMLALGVSKGFTYTWDTSAPAGSRVVAGSMKLNGVPLVDSQTYRVSTVNFLADGGDMFTEFTRGTNRLGGKDDLVAFTEYLGANPGLTPPAPRSTRLP